MGRARAERSLNLWPAVPAVGLSVGAACGLVRGWPYYANPLGLHYHDPVVLTGFVIGWAVAIAIPLVPALALALFLAGRLVAWVRERRDRPYADAIFEEIGARGPSWRRPTSILAGLFGAFWGRWKWFMLGIAGLYALALYFGPKTPANFSAPSLPVYGDPTTVR